MLRGLNHGSDFRGNRPFFVHGPYELGIKDYPFIYPNEVISNELNIEGFAHFQICFEITEPEVEMQVWLLKGQLTDYGFTSRANPWDAFIMGFHAKGDRSHTRYWGIAAPAATACNDDYRFSRTVRIKFRLLEAKSMLLTAWLECMG